MSSSLTSSLTVASPAKDRFAHLMQLLPAGLLVLDETGVIIEVNSQAITLLGEPLLGQSWRTVSQRSFIPQADDGHEISLHNGRRVRLATRALDPEPGQLLLLTDLTETRQLQQDLAHLERLSALGKMAASFAHQIRTPLAAALLYANNLDNDKLDAQGRARFQGKMLERLSELEQRVNDLLLFARGGHTQGRSLVNVANLCQQLAHSCEALLQHNGAQFYWQCEPKTQLNANADALLGCLQNLFTNALEAQAKRLDLVIQTEGDWLKLTLLDDGIGINAEQQKQITTPFFTTKTNGTGLGLAVVQAVCRSHNGRLEWTSTLGQGSAFTLLLPLSG